MVVWSLVMVLWVFRWSSLHKLISSIFYLRCGVATCLCIFKQLPISSVGLFIFKLLWLWLYPGGGSLLDNVVHNNIEANIIIMAVSCGVFLTLEIVFKALYMVQIYKGISVVGRRYKQASFCHVDVIVFSPFIVVQSLQHLAGER